MIKTAYDFCAALLAATAGYILGDALWAWGARHESLAARRAGGALIAAAASVLALLAVLLLQLARLPIGEVWGGG